MALSADDVKWNAALSVIGAQLTGSPVVTLYYTDKTNTTIDAVTTLRHFLEVNGLRVPTGRRS